VANRHTKPNRVTIAKIITEKSRRNLGSIEDITMAYLLD
jgi:hypothetical protein